VVTSPPGSGSRFGISATLPAGVVADVAPAGIVTAGEMLALRATQLVVAVEKVVVVVVERPVGEWPETHFVLAVAVGAVVGRPVSLRIACGRSIVWVRRSSDRNRTTFWTKSVPLNPILVTIGSRTTARP